MDGGTMLNATEMAFMIRRDAKKSIVNFISSSIIF